jgi:hypothetical protein
MANKKISEFPNVVSSRDDDIILMDQLGATKTITYGTLKNNIAGNKITAPTPATDGQVLTYQDSTTSWIASSIRAGTGDYYDSVPIGTVSWFSASAVPTGYLECNGQIVSKAQYSELWTTIRDTFSAVALSANHFRVPDLRSEFIRGWDNGRGIDSGRIFGSKQADEFKSHSHQYQLKENRTGSGFDAWNGMSDVGMFLNNTTSTGGTETRPRNVALLPCIKAVRTVTGTTNALNFIPKPATATAGQALVFDSTNTWVASSIPVGTTGSGLGYEQNYVDCVVDSSRTIGVTYTNSTGKPIYIKIRYGYSSESVPRAILVVNGVTLNRVSDPGSIDAIIPKDATYSFGSGDNSLVISEWIELR